MANALSSDVRQVKPPQASSTGWFVALGLGIWLVLVVFLGAAEAFVAPAGNPPLALLAAVTSPVLLFLAAWWLSPPVREFVRAGNVRFMTAIQAWRIGGFTFLVLYAYGILPGYFAWPAGVGDMAIGITAPWILDALTRQPGFLGTRGFVAWNIFGILDLVVAVGMGALGGIFINDAVVGAGATNAMSRLPLVLIPVFFVPIFIILHIAALSRAPALSAR